MPPSLAALLVAALLSAGWLLGRRRGPLVRNPDTHAVAALNRAQIALVQSGGASQPQLAMPGTARPPGRAATQAAGPLAGQAPVGSAALGFYLPGMGPGAADGINTAARLPASLLAALEALFRGDASSRLQAIEAAHRWGNRRCLPLLRRGLRDPDPVVMRAAAVAIERFRGRPGAPAAQSRPQGAAAPRKVSRTR
ncbi:MAG: HEAT repeat domain-containing protein [Cyanobium sp.]